MKPRGIKTVNAPKVWHVGFMDPQAKANGSYEGAGLSVSRHPKEWTQIAKLGGRPTWKLTKTSGSFLDARKLTKAEKRAIVTWGMQQGLVAPVKVWRFWFTDETDEICYMDFLSRKEAEEALEEEEDGARIEEVESLIGTQALADRAYNSSATRDPVGVMDLLLTCWVEDTTELDGVWWSERLDPDQFSAPRGVILPSRISSWSATVIG